MELSPPAINCCFCDKNLSPGENQQATKPSTITKYKCPACERVYCSADCCSGHKEKFSCPGIRNPTPYVHLSKFDQKQFLDDYFFLEKVGNKIESAQRAATRLRCKKGNQGGVGGVTNTKNNRRRFNKRRNKKTGQQQPETATNADSTTVTDQK